MQETQFLAICKDRPDDPDGFYYTVYFVNNTNQEIRSLNYETSGFTTFDGELIQTDVITKQLGNLASYSAVEIEKDDEGSFDFAIHFEFVFTLNNQETVTKKFHIGKYLSGGEESAQPLPVIEKPGVQFYSS